jgi:hypothetical protein|nr:hypothetical protein [Leptotrichia trevisanii]DAI55145.1 MAG TPA: hypothetical protein [Caudoviricetes sp.]DAQ00670.1 MAG TPA: hypothetical protein [Caudoviricetes sp.]
MEEKKSLDEWLKIFEEGGSDDEDDEFERIQEEIKKENEERDARLAKMTPKERAKAIVDEIFKDASDA